MAAPGTGSSSRLEIKGTEGICWQGLVPVLSGVQMAFLLPQVQRALHFTAKVHLMRNRFSGFGPSSESPGGEGRPPRSWMWTSALWGLSFPLPLEPQGCLSSRGKGVLRGGGGGKSQSPRKWLKGAGERRASEPWAFQLCRVLFFLDLGAKLGNT